MLETSHSIRSDGRRGERREGEEGDGPHGFEYETEMPSMFECSFETDEMAFIVWIGCLDFLKDLDFFETCFVPVV